MAFLRRTETVDPFGSNIFLPCDHINPGRSGRSHVFNQSHLGRHFEPQPSLSLMNLQIRNRRRPGSRRGREAAFGRGAMRRKNRRMGASWSIVWWQNLMRAHRRIPDVRDRPHQMRRKIESGAWFVSALNEKRGRRVRKQKNPAGTFSRPGAIPRMQLRH